ncbi:hypothetical protein ACQ4PT_024413 [Festuca glaucescens]
MAAGVHYADKHEEALACAIVLAGGNPGSALALDFVRYLHVHVGGLEALASAIVLAGANPGSALSLDLVRYLHVRVGGLEALGSAIELAAANPGSAVALDLVGYGEIDNNPPPPPVRGFSLTGPFSIPPVGHLHVRVGGLEALPSAIVLAFANPGSAVALDLVRYLHFRVGGLEALDCAIVLDGANQGSVLALNLVGHLHVHDGGVAWNETLPADEKAAPALEARHFRPALDAFSAAARIAPNCVPTAVFHAEAFAVDAQLELLRVLSTTATNHADPAVNHARALFDAKLSPETECRRAPIMEEPTDPDLDDIPPAVSSVAADYEFQSIF